MKTLRQGLRGAGLAAAGVVAGMLASASLAGGQIGQDPQVAQLRQELNSFRIAAGQQINNLTLELDEAEREITAMRQAISNLEQAERSRRFLPRAEHGQPVPTETLAVTTMTARSFVLRDVDGTTYGALTVREDGPALTLLDADGQPLAILQPTDDGAELQLRGADGAMRPIRRP